MFRIEAGDIISCRKGKDTFLVKHITSSMTKSRRHKIHLLHIINKTTSAPSSASCRAAPLFSFEPATPISIAEVKEINKVSEEEASNIIKDFNAFNSKSRDKHRIGAIQACIARPFESHTEHIEQSIDLTISKEYAKKADTGSLAAAFKLVFKRGTKRTELSKISWSTKGFEFDASKLLKECQENEKLLKDLEKKWSSISPSTNDISYTIIGKNNKLFKKEIKDETHDVSDDAPKPKSTPRVIQKEEPEPKKKRRNEESTEPTSPIRINISPIRSPSSSVVTPPTFDAPPEFAFVFKMMMEKTEELLAERKKTLEAESKIKALQNQVQELGDKLSKSETPADSIVLNSKVANLIWEHLEKAGIKEEKRTQYKLLSHFIELCGKFK